MKTHTLLLATIIALPLILSQCITVDPGYATQLPGSAPRSRPTRSAYDSGIYRGREDGSGGRSRNPSRHYGTFPPSQTAEFNRGYEVGYNQGIRPGGGNIGFNQPLTAITSFGAVTIRQGSRTLCSFRTASPNVEQTRFVSEQEQIVVKSRGNHGPATVQLFDSRSGRELGRVMAYEIRGGQPRWAAPFAE